MLPWAVCPRHRLNMTILQRVPHVISALETSLGPQKTLIFDIRSCTITQHSLPFDSGGR